MLPQITGGLAGIGQGLGTAHGSIVIDTADLDRAKKVAAGTGRDIGQSLQQGIGGGARRAVQGLSQLRAGLRSLNRELAVIGATAGAATFFGLGAARDIRAYRIAYETLLGSQREGDRIMRRLTSSANEYGLELNSVLALGRAILPILKGNVEATDEWVLRAARLRTVLPTAQQGAELRAITEFLADQTISLQRLFNIPPELIQEARRQFSDAGEQLDFILDKMGATEDAARRMADPIVSVKNELRLIAAVGFTPLLEDVRDMATEFRVWLEELRETNPELLKIGASAVAAVAIGAPLLVFLNQVLATLVKIRQVAALAALGKIGLVAGAGLFAAREGLRAVGRDRDDDRLSDISFREMFFEAFKWWNELAKIIQALLLDTVRNFQKAVGTMIGVMGRFVQRLADFIPGRPGETLRNVGAGMLQTERELREGADAWFAMKMEEQMNKMDAIVTQFGVWVGVLPSQLDKLRAAEQEERRRTPVADAGGGGRLGQLFRDMDANAVPGGIAEWMHFWSELHRIREETSAEILAAEQESAQQRAEIVTSYNRQQLRDEEDFARQRARAEEDFQRQIDAINNDRVEREAEWQEDLNKRIAEIQADAARDRARMEEDHRDNLLSAASRLDARAVAEENRRFNRQMTRFEEDLQERIDGEREAHRERVANGREADEERIRDLQAFHDRRKAREDEDREIRLARMQEDHERQLEQFDEQAGKRIQQIKDQAADERAAAADAYRDRLREQGIYYTSFLTEQARRQGDSLRSWQDYWDDFQRAQRDGQRDGRTGGDSGRGGTSGGAGGTQPSRRELETQAIDLMQQAGWDPRVIYNQTRTWRTWTDAQLARWMESTFGVDVPGYLMGTPFVRDTGLAMLHRGEAVIDPATSSLIRAALGSTFSAASLRSAVTSGASGGGRSIQMGDVSIAIQGSTNMNEAQLKRAVRQGIMDALEEVAA